MNKVPPIVEVTWLDTLGWGTWGDVNDRKEKARNDTYIHKSVGYLMEQTSKHVLISQSISRDTDNVDNSLSYPRRNVQRITVLRKASEW